MAESATTFPYDVRLRIATKLVGLADYIPELISHLKSRGWAAFDFKWQDYLLQSAPEEREGRRQIRLESTREVLGDLGAKYNSETGEFTVYRSPLLDELRASWKAYYALRGQNPPGPGGAFYEWNPERHARVSRDWMTGHSRRDELNQQARLLRAQEALRRYGQKIWPSSFNDYDARWAFFVEAWRDHMGMLGFEPDRTLTTKKRPAVSKYLCDDWKLAVLLKDANSVGLLSNTGSFQLELLLGRGRFKRKAMGAWVPEQMQFLSINIWCLVYGFSVYSEFESFDALLLCLDAHNEYYNFIGQKMETALREVLLET